MVARLAPAIALMTTLALAAIDPGGAAATLSVTTSASPTFSANLDNGDQTPSYGIALTVANTGVGNTAGWNLTITSTQLTTGGTTPHTLATTASTVTGATAGSCSGVLCVGPTNGVAYPVTVPAGGTPPTAVKFYNAAANSGTGTVTVTPTISVAVPRSSYAGSYTSTLTFAVISGP